MADSSTAEMVRQARDARAAGRPAEALAAIHAVFAQSATLKRLAAALLAESPGIVEPKHGDMVLGLVRDLDIEPQSLAEAGWLVTLSGIPGNAADRALAERLESNELALALLEEAPVIGLDAELRLAGLRRWLLIERAWPDFPRLTAALVDQARINGGAWWFDDQERALIGSPACAPLAQAYLPQRIGVSADTASAVGGAVARQYERWPYPRWRRITAPAAERLPDVVARLDPAFQAHMPAAAQILVAGCGTGRQAAAVAATFREAQVTAIDISAASLDYARGACRAMRLSNLSFVQLDLNEVADLGIRFHAVYCAGVLHHLEDPEAGWASLAQALRPGGVMRLAVYSAVARMGVALARRRLANLAAGPTDDDLIRLARHRLLQARDDVSARWMTRSGDFATLEGACDLLLHPHEDPFTPLRIGKALEATGMRLLRFVFSRPKAASDYEAMFPDDPGHRDLAALARFERRHPTSFAGMYDFWCGRPA